MPEIKRNLMFSCLGNGVTVCDTLHEEDGDYEQIAHISPEGNITYYVSFNNLSLEEVQRIEHMAEEEKKNYFRRK